MFLSLVVALIVTVVTAVALLLVRTLSRLRSAKSIRYPKLPALSKLVTGKVCLIYTCTINHLSQGDMWHVANKEGDVQLICDSKHFIDESGAAKRLSRAIQFKTVSMAENDFDQKEMTSLVKYIEQAFPLVHSCPWIQRTVLNEYSLMYKCLSLTEEKCPSMKPTEQTRPWMLIGHLDVVPVADNDSVHWSRPPFSGDIVASKVGDNPNDPDNVKHIYGRGSLDAKDIVFGTLEALELAIKNGQRPKLRSFYLVFGHDEETGGIYGAQKVARYLKAELFKRAQPKAKPHTGGQSNGVGAVEVNDDGIMVENDGSECQEAPLYFILDEGFNIFDDLLKDQNLGLISIAEKVCCKVTLTANTKPGHSSMPSKDTAISILSQAVSKLHNTNYGSMINKGGPEIGTMKLIAPHVNNWFLKIAFANSDLFAPILANRINKHPLMGSFVKTVSCITKIQGGIKDNIVPSEAKAVVMQRIYPIQSLEEIMAINKEAVGDDRIKMEVESVVPKIPLSCYDDISPDGNYTGYHHIKRTVLQLFQDTIVAPIIMPGATDSKHFVGLARDIYRFSPVVMATSDLRGVHGNDERIRVSSYRNLIEFYYRLMDNVSCFTGVTKLD